LEGVIIFKRILIPLFLATLTARAAGDAMVPADNISFSIKPHLCVVSDTNEICEDQLIVSWDSKDKRSLCLYQQDKKLPLRCWENEHFGSHSFLLATANNIEFKLVEMAERTELASKQFEVVKSIDNFRRRRRNPWSFF